MLEEEVTEVCAKIAAALEWQGDYFSISAFQKRGTDILCHKVMDFIDSLPPEPEDNLPSADEVGFKWDSYHEEVIENHADDDDDDFDDDDYDVEVEYKK
jgi:GTP-binding protein